LPRTWIDETKCADGLRAIRDYREKVDPKRRVSLGPLHDWTSHAADALRYLMTAYAEPQAKREQRPQRRVSANSWMGI
jgi:phage terminase large subunit